MEDTPSRQHPEAGPSAAPARRWRLDIRAATWALAVFALELSQYLARLWRLRIGDAPAPAGQGSSADGMRAAMVAARPLR